MSNLDVIIAGAGIGGLSAAIALKRAGHRVRLLERARVLAPVGAAISIWPNGMKVLHALGVGPQVEAMAGDMASMSYRDSRGRLLTRFDLAPLYRHAAQPACPIARAALQQILLAAAGPSQVSLGVSCDGYSEAQDGVRVRLSDGQEMQADLLVAADGTHSTLRNQVAGTVIERRYSGYVNWNGRIAHDSDLGDGREWAQYVDDYKRVSLMPMGQGELYFFFDVPLPRGTPNLPDRYREDLRRHFRGWAAPVQALIDRLDPHAMARVEIHDTERLPRLVSARVALIGDAAHAMTPNIGQGGCQAMEDAWVLAGCLTEGASVPEALKAYERARADRVAHLVLKARERAAIIHGQDPQATQAWYAGLPTSEAEILAGLARTVDGGPL